MDLFFGGIVAGLTGGVAYGLLAFAVVWLYKASGIANFAQGAMATAAAFFVWAIADSSAGLGKVFSLALGACAAMLLGGIVYVVVIRPRVDAGPVNIIMRTLGVYLLIQAALNIFWSDGQPFTFPEIIPEGRAFSALGVSVSWLTVVAIILAAALATIFAIFFKRTRLGLLFLGLAERPEIARLLGVRTTLLTFVAWLMAGAIALFVGIMVAPSALLTTGMTDPYLLFAFAAAIIGGLNSLSGSLVGGLIVGVVNSLTTIYSSSDVAFLAVFAIFLLTLTIRPQGLFGHAVDERL